MNVRDRITSIRKVLREVEDGNLSSSERLEVAKLYIALLEHEKVSYGYRPAVPVEIANKNGDVFTTVPNGSLYLVRAKAEISPFAHIAGNVKELIFTEFTILGYGCNTRVYEVGDIVKTYGGLVVKDIANNTLEDRYLNVEKFNDHSVIKAQKELTALTKLTPKDVEGMKPIPVYEYGLFEEHQIKCKYTITSIASLQGGLLSNDGMTPIKK